MRRISYIIVLLFATVISAVAQTGIPSEGREFYLGLLVPSTPREAASSSWHASKYNAYLLITATANANVAVNYFDANGVESGTTVKIGARQGTQVQLDMSKFKISDTTGEHVQYSTCHILSDVPITVQVVSVGTSAGGSYLSLPVQCLGKQYVVQSYNDNPSGAGGMFSTRPSRSCMEIIAAEDGTQVQITPAATTNGGRPGVSSGPGSNGKPQPFTVGLSRGHTYTIFSLGSDANSDLTGTIVTANKRIVVLGGHEAAFTAGSSDQLQWTEGRDLMMEQMIPVECWDDHGYASIPFVDSKPSTAAGSGDELRVVTLPSNGNQVMISDGGPSATTASVPNYGSFSVIGVSSPLGLFDQKNKPFGVMLYDQRMQGTGAPYPTPSMSTIVPKSRWKSEYYFFVQSTKYGGFQRYMYLVVPKADWNASKIMMSFNGGSLMPVSSAGVSIKRVWASIPADSTLMGIALSLNNNGSYYVTDLAANPAQPDLRSAFFAYYDANVVDYGYTVGGAPTYYDDVFSYANLLGITYGEYGTVHPKMSATVKDECGYWSVCVRDSGDEHTGIRFVDLLNYPKNTYSSSIAASVNARLDASLDPARKNEILLPGTDGELCFRVERVNPADTSSAAVEVYDNSGASILVQLRSSAALSATSSSSLKQTTATLFTFGTTAVDSPLCGNLVVSIPAGLGAHNQSISAITMTGDTARFRFASSLPSMPLTIRPGTPLSLPVCFYPQDTTLASVRIELSGDCDSKFSYTLIGHGASGALFAGDAQFPLTDSGDKNCTLITLKNTGNRSLVLDAAPVLSDTLNFGVDPQFATTLPVKLAPGDSTSVQVCFHPIDGNSHMATLRWQSDLTSAMETRSKVVSMLTGKGYSPAVEWSPSSLDLVADSTTTAPSSTGRIYLANRGTVRRILVRSIALAGLDSAEFSIVGNEYGVDPLKDFYIAASDSMWLDVRFHPDVNKPYPDKFAPRSAYVLCTYDVEGTGTEGSLVGAELSGKFAGASNRVEPEQMSEARLEVFQRGHQVIVGVPASETGSDIRISLYDVLGRPIARPTLLLAIPDQGWVPMEVPQTVSGTVLVSLACGTHYYFGKTYMIK